MRQLKHFPFGHHWHVFDYMHTQPLLFDECISIPQKIAALWHKLNALIEDYNQFKADFNKWKKQVEDTLDDLQKQIDDFKKTFDEWKKTVESRLETLDQRVTDLETKIKEIDEIKKRVDALEKSVADMLKTVNQHTTDIDDLKKRITSSETNIQNIQQSITNITTNIQNITKNVSDLKTVTDDHEARIKKLEELLQNLNIDVPIEVLSKDTVLNSVGPAWLNWFAGICGNSFDRSGWKFSGKITEEEPTAPDAGITIGRVVSNVIKCKLPMSMYHDLVITDTSYANLYQQVKTFIESQNIRNFIYPLYPGNGFFDVTLDKPYPVQMDEFKFMGSYIPFINPSPEGGQAMPVWKIMRSATGEPEWYLCQAWNVSIRLQTTANSTSAKLAVVGDCVYIGWYNNRVYIYAICEIG